MRARRSSSTSAAAARASSRAKRRALPSRTQTPVPTLRQRSRRCSVAPRSPHTHTNAPCQAAVALRAAMASELSRFIEDELRCGCWSRGFASAWPCALPAPRTAKRGSPCPARAAGTRALPMTRMRRRRITRTRHSSARCGSRCARAATPAAAPCHSCPDSLLLTSAPSQARVKEQETQKKLFNIKRVVCIGGGVALVLVAWALLIASSKGRTDPGALLCGWGGQYMHRDSASLTLSLPGAWRTAADAAPASCWPATTQTTRPLLSSLRA